MSSASTATVPESTATQLLLLELGGGLYAVERGAVREIVLVQRATRLPGAPAYVRGLMNLRGQLVTVVDLVCRLTGEPMSNPEGSTIVVQSGASLLGLSVDEVRDVQALETSAAEGLPYHAAEHGLIRGLGRLEGEVVIVLDVDEVVRQTLA
jgi:purine-binding chemotaxis protein CheW